MDELTRQALRQQWSANEMAIADAHALKAGGESPIERVEKLDQAQDEIEFDLASDYVRRQRAKELE